MTLQSAPRSRQRMRTGIALGLVGAAVLFGVSGCAAWRLAQARELAQRSEPFSQFPAVPSMRLLIVGDSTAVGTGASSPQASLAGLIARDHPQWLIDNRGQDGALFADVVRQLAIDEHYDMVLVLAGGNDVIRMRDRDAMRADIDRMASAAAARAPVVLLMPSGNVGNAPFFFPPVSWLMTSRSRALHDFVALSAARSGFVYVDLFRERSTDPFVADRSLNASDGLHPSDAGYRNWWAELQRQAALARQPAKAEVPRPMNHSSKGDVNEHTGYRRIA